MVDIGTCARNIFRQVYQIHIADMYHQAHGSFGLIGIGNVGNQVLTKPLVVSGLQNLANNAQELRNFYYTVRSDMISKAIEVSIKKNYLKKLRLNQG